MKYYARPYTDVPYAREKYKHESSVLHELTGDLILCTIPLTEYYEIFFNKAFEQKIFDIAEEMIKQCDMLTYIGDSKGVRKEIAIAKKYGVPVIEYYNYIKEVKNERD